MYGTGEPAPVAENRLDELIAAYLQALQEGELPDRAALVGQHPELAEQLQEFFDDHDWMQRLAGEPVVRHEPLAEDESHQSLKTTLIVAPAARRGRRRGGRTDGADPPGSFGDYDLLDEVGHGGMGVVYKARQCSLNRLVALKMIRFSHLASNEEIERFRSEAELAAGLDHPGIVPIYEVGEVAGQHYYSMALVEGLSLEELLKQDQVFAPQTAAELVRRSAVAIDFAHRRGVVHRDLKPANILLAPVATLSGIRLIINATEQFCEPKVTDFGLAKRAESDSGLTGTGQILGTPSYMSPEQARGDISNVGRVADVYSLGAVLYCLLTGRPPFRAANVLETLKQVIHDEPVPPRQLNSAIPRDLETICLKCLSKSPSRRYDSAQELADDLQRFQNSEPVLARAIGTLERTWKWIRRRPTAATLVVLTLVAALASVGLVVSYAYQVERERILYAAKTMLALQWFQNDEPMRAADLLKTSEPHQRGFEYDFLNRLLNARELPKLNGNAYIDSSQIHGMYKSLGVDLEYSPDGSYLAASMGRGPVLIWDLQTGTEPVKLEGHTEKVQGLAFSSTGRLLATAGREGSIRFWRRSSDDRQSWHPADVASALIPEIGATQPVAEHSTTINSVDFSPDDQHLASAGADGCVRLWDVATGSQIAAQLLGDGPNFDVKDVVFSPDGTLLAAACADGVIRLLDSQKLTNLDELKASTQVIYSLSFDPSGDRLAGAGQDGRIRIWNVRQRQESVFCEGHSAGVVSLAFIRDGKGLISAGAHDQTIKLWEAATGRLVQVVAEDPDGRLSRDFGQIAVHPNGRNVATTSDDNVVRFFTLGHDREARAVKAHAGPVRCIDIRPDGLMASGGEDGQIRLWQRNPIEISQTVLAHSGPVNSVAFSPDGLHFASCGQDKAVRLWNASNGQMLWDNEAHRDAAYAVGFHPDGKLLASSGHDGEIVLWNVADGKILTRHRNRTEYDSNSPASSLAFHPGGGQIAVGGWDGRVVVYSLSGTTLSPEQNLTGHVREVLSVAYSRDGRHLVSGDREGHLIVWDVDRGSKIARLPDSTAAVAGHIGPVTAAVFTDAGNRVISSGWDGLLHVWDIESRQVVLTLNGRHGRSHCTVLTDKDRYFASGHHDGTIMLWGR
jgi:eukaryotic-like serine/threonine-protein kinase